MKDDNNNKEEIKEEINIEDLMKENLELRNELNVEKSKNENVENLNNELKQDKEKLSQEIDRLKQVNQEFFLQLSKQNEGLIKPTVLENSKPTNDDNISLDDLIDKIMK